MGTGDISKCSEEYLKDYGWMGTIDHYRKLCAKKKLNPNFEWPREMFENSEKKS